jgi:hypothetical protein
MDVRKVVFGALLVMFLFAGLTVAVPAGAAEEKTMWCNITSGDFYQLCQDEEFMKGLTPEQRKAIDKEWQRRYKEMTPAERELYYPAGRRYYQGS